MAEKRNNKTPEQRAALALRKGSAPAAKKGPDSAMTAFWIVFLVAFIAFTLVLTPVMAAVSDFRPFAPAGGDEDGEDEEFTILEEYFDDYFVPSSSPFYAAFKDTNRVNCLLIGLKSGLTDTIMVISFDTDNRHVDTISIPRDTYYHREGYNSDAENKINAAYRKDPLNTAIAVSDVLLGMPINYYAVIEDGGVQAVVDSMGGVPMDIPFHMVYNDPRDDPPLHIDIPEGPQILDGENSVHFLRYRKGYPEGDIGRVKAQQVFIRSAFKTALTSDLPKLSQTIRENVLSDIPMSKMLFLAQKVIGMSSDDISTYTMPGNPMSVAPYYVYPDTMEIENLIREIYSLQPEQPETSTDAAISNDSENDE
jgi:LCP family protein required for cell wall assembly